MTAKTEGPGMTVAVADPIHAAGLDRLRSGFDVAYLPDLDHEAGIEALTRAEAIVVRTFIVDPAAMDRAPKLRLIVKHGAGVDNIDIPSATDRGIAVVNTPGSASSAAVAEGAVTLMLAVLRRVPEMDRLVRDGRYGDRWTVSLGDLTGRRLGLVGFGRIARNVARTCGAGFGMEVAAYDPFVPAETISETGAQAFDDLEALAARSDVLSVHVPLSDRTRGVVGAKVLAALPRHAVVVNTSRGGTVDETALAEALRSGSIAGAGLDVFETEPPSPSDPLFALPNVVASPHMAGVTEGSLRGMSLDVAEVISEVAAGRKPATLLNAAWPAQRKN